MSQLYQSSCRYSVTTLSPVDTLGDAAALLLIGDAALRAYTTDFCPYIYDLGLLWRDWTGLPFVFALWLCRSEVSGWLELKELSTSLIKTRTKLPEYYSTIAEQAPEAKWMGRDKLLSYWRDNISYDLDQRKISGLMMFYQKCSELGLIESVPALTFAFEAE